jgi:hypothetical protein
MAPSWTSTRVPCKWPSIRGPQGAVAFCSFYGNVHTVIMNNTKKFLCSIYSLSFMDNICLFVLEDKILREREDIQNFSYEKITVKGFFFFGPVIQIIIISVKA